VGFFTAVKYSMIYCLYTLVDITETGHYKSRNDLERHQQQNFDTVVQTIGLSSNIEYTQSPKIIPADIFGSEADKCWYFEWTTDRDYVFESSGDMIAKLKETFQFVPFIPNLNETVEFKMPIFILGNNIIFDYKQ
jgi:hypothetical protein